MLWPITCSISDFVKYTFGNLVWRYTKTYVLFWQSQCINCALQLNGWYVQIEPLPLTLNFIYFTTITGGYKLATRWSCWVENKYETFSVRENHCNLFPGWKTLTYSCRLWDSNPWPPSNSLVVKTPRLALTTLPLSSGWTFEGNLECIHTFASCRRLYQWYTSFICCSRLFYMRLW